MSAELTGFRKVTQPNVRLEVGQTSAVNLQLPLGELIRRLRATYCGTIGVEYMNIADKTQRDWLARQMEPILNKPAFAPEEFESADGHQQKCGDTTTNRQQTAPRSPRLRLACSSDGSDFSEVDILERIDLG